MGAGPLGSEMEVILMNGISTRTCCSKWILRAGRRLAHSRTRLIACGVLAGALVAPLAAAQQLKVYLYVEKPGLFGAGHAWVGLDQGNGPEWKGGLYPGKSGAKGARNSPGVIRDDSGRQHTHKVCYNVTAAQYNAIVAAITNKINNGTTYQLCPAQTAGPGTNCAGWATQKLRTGGVTTPNPTNRAGYPDPYTLGEIIGAYSCGQAIGDGVRLCVAHIEPHEYTPLEIGAQRDADAAYISGGYYGFIIMAHGNPQGLATQLIMPVEDAALGPVAVGAGAALTVSLENVAAEAITSVEWGDGAMFDEGAVTFTHVYGQSGVYDASAIVIDDGAVRRWTFSVNVGVGSAAAISITAPDFEPARQFDYPAPPIVPPAFVDGPIPVRGDFNLDGIVDAHDLSSLLGDWGSEGGPCDLNDDWSVDSADLAMLLSVWGMQW